MFQLSHQTLEAYLKEQFGPQARLTGFGDMAAVAEQDIKAFGYGKPVLVRFEVAGLAREAVLSTMRRDDYGHQFPWDRAAILLFQHATSGRMEAHAKPLGLGYLDGDDRLRAADPKEFFVLWEKLEGRDYYHDLKRILDGGLRPADLAFAEALARFLARLHAEKYPDAADRHHLYNRRVRDTIGASECVMGLIDEAYPARYEPYPPERFAALERRLVDWRWRLKDHTARLAAVHGDFHPFNILAREDGSFGVLDRSRGEWGEPAGDVVCMAINYVLFGLLDATAKGGPLRLAGPFRELYDTFWAAYLKASGDRAMPLVCAPFVAFRTLVIASPQWYPHHPPGLREAMFTLMDRALAAERFDYKDIDDLLP